MALTKSPLQPWSTSSKTVLFWNGKILSRISMLVSLPGLNAVGMAEGCESPPGLSSFSFLAGGESLLAGELGLEVFVCSTRGLAVRD